MARSPSSGTPEQQLARSVLTRNLGVRKGENVAIEAWTHSLPFAVPFAREARRLGAHPILLFDDEEAYWDSVAAGETAVLSQPGKHEWKALEATDAYVYFWGPSERDRYDGMSEAKREKLVEYNDRWYEVARRSGLRGVRLELGRVCPSMAGRWKVEEGAWTNGLIQASMADPSRLKKLGAKVAGRLARGKEVHITHENGTDLTLRLMGAKPRTTNGLPAASKKRGQFGMMASVPAGTVLTALDHEVAEGHLLANRPSYLERSRTDGADWTFAAGHLAQYSFTDGAKHFEEGYAKATKGRDRPGVISFGLNEGSRALPAVEDIELGAVLVSVGGNTWAGGKNASNGFNWAMVGGATVEVDGKPLLEAGRFV